MRQIDTDKARQGRWGTQVLMVLIGGLLLASIAWYAAENYGEAIETPATADGGGGTTQPQTQQQ
jgi:hypothetical protein